MPHIIFRQNEIEAHISFELDKIDPEKLFQIEKLLGEMGISFDTGCGCGYRDWFADYSLIGPMHITFARKRKTMRKECSRCTLARIWR